MHVERLLSLGPAGLSLLDSALDLLAVPLKPVSKGQGSKVSEGTLIRLGRRTQKSTDCAFRLKNALSVLGPVA